MYKKQNKWFSLWTQKRVQFLKWKNTFSEYTKKRVETLHCGIGSAPEHAKCSDTSQKSGTKHALKFGLWNKPKKGIQPKWKERFTNWTPKGV